MLPFTPQERQALIFSAFVFLFGLSFKLFFFMQPSLAARVTVLDEPHYRPKVDLNRASYDDILAVPHIGPSTAGKILRYRQAKGGIHSLDELTAALGGKSAAVEKFAPYVEMR